ncbi:hypothetical protein CI610_01964 [invertebrate metagenome]|uniref:Type IV pilin Tt1218-like domain-containing protein n=1 Tax=invertebrate metagenome TaxID=1711999 RepID=A0A2H9T767_9ZZZZ
MEVMISIVIISFVFLWISNSHISAVRTVTDSNQRSRAIWLAQEMLERMKMNAGQYDNYKTRIDAGVSCSSTVSCQERECSADEMIQYDLQQVFCQTSQVSGFAMTFSCSGSPCQPGNRVSVDVSWNAIGAVGGVATGKRQFTVLEMVR